MPVVVGMDCFKGKKRRRGGGLSTAGAWQLGGAMISLVSGVA